MKGQEQSILDDDTIEDPGPPIVEMTRMVCIRGVWRCKTRTVGCCMYSGLHCSNGMVCLY